MKIRKGTNSGRSFAFFISHHRLPWLVEGHFFRLGLLVRLESLGFVGAAS
jgi:hypothetical protein